MATSSEIKQRANALAEKTDVNSITPKEVGGIMYDLASHSENVLRNGGTLGIRKVYESVAAMEADSTNPKDFWGDPIKKGNLVVIYDGTTTGVDNNKIYAFMKPGWEPATKLDAAYATKAETDAKLAELCSEYVLSNDSYIDGDTIYIGTLFELVPGKVAQGYAINSSYYFDSPYLLLFDTVNKTVRREAQEGFKPNDVCLLWYGRNSYGVKNEFNFVGALGNVALYSKLTKNINKAKHDSVYIISNDSRINGNTIYIGNLHRFKPKTSSTDLGETKTYILNETYSLTGGQILVFNMLDENVYIKSQSEITYDDDILLWASSSGQFNNVGKLSSYTLNVNIESAKFFDVQYLLSSDYDIIGNSIYIGTIYRLTNKNTGDSAESYQINHTFSLTPGQLLVFNNDNKQVEVKNQAQFIGNYDILLWASSSGQFNNVGKLSSYTPGTTKLDEYNLKTELIGEAIFSVDGAVYKPCDGVQKKAFSTPCYLRLNGELDKIIEVELQDDERYILYQYDKDFVMVGRNENSLSLVKSCRYVKLVITRIDMSEYAYSKKCINLKVQAKENPEWVYNVGDKSQSDPNYLFRTYEVINPYITDNTDTPTTQYRGNVGRVMNRGYIYLPVNYTPDGKPCKVVIYCNGTSGYDFNAESLPYNDSYVNFLAKCGYAVIGCSTRTEMYNNVGHSADGDLVHPLSYSCYESLWHYMTNSFNIDKTGAYIYGLSSGGMMSIMIPQLKTIPIKCAASHAGSVDMFSNMRICVGGLNKFWLQMLGVEYNGGLPDGLSSSGVMKAVDSNIKELIKNNIDKFKGYNPFWFKNDIDIDSFLDEYFATNNYTENLESNQNLVNIVNSSKLYLDIPYKIWHAVDDVNVPIAMSRFFRRMVLNGGGICYLRELPEDCGAHHAVGVDTDDDLTPKTEYTTPYGEKVTVAVAYAELVDWFNRW